MFDGHGGDGWLPVANFCLVPDSWLQHHAAPTALKGRKHMRDVYNPVPAPSARAVAAPASLDALVGSLATSIADRIAKEIQRRDRIRQQQVAATATSPFMTIEEAAAYLRCKPQRIYDLVWTGRISRHKDGSRVLIRRDELAAYVRCTNPRRD